MKMSRALRLVLLMNALLAVVACDDVETARRSERAFDSPYANPEGNDVTCESGSYLVGQRCVSESERLDARVPSADAALDAAPEATDAALLDAGPDATDAAHDARDGSPEADAGAPDAGDAHVIDADSADADAAEAAADDAALDASPEGDT